VVGDLGNMGGGSLDCISIDIFLPVVLQSVVSFHTSNSTCSTNANQQRIDLSYKILLELAARLLNVAQRYYLVGEESMKLVDPTQVMIEYIKQQPHPDDYYRNPTRAYTHPTCTAAILHQSPFVKLILRSIYAGLTLLQLTIDPTDEPRLLQQAMSMSDSINDTAPSAEKRLLAMLHILCVSAELYPLGSSCPVTKM
jgi:hypothetical protein